MLPKLRTQVAAGLTALAARIDPQKPEPEDVPAPRVTTPSTPASWSVANLGPSPIRATWPVNHDVLITDEAFNSEEARQAVAGWQRTNLKVLDRLISAPVQAPPC